MTTPVPQAQTNPFKAIIRSLTPFAIAAVVGGAAHLGYHVTMGTAAAIVAGAGGFITVAVHALEPRYPWVGVFLGWLGAPGYTPTTKVTVVSLQAEIDALKAQQAEAAHRSPPSA